MNLESLILKNRSSDLKDLTKTFTWFREKVNNDKNICYYDYIPSNQNYRIVESVRSIVVSDEKEIYQNELSQLISFEDFELGKVTQSEEYFYDLLCKSTDMGQMIINQIYHDAIINYDKHTIIGILYIIAQMPYDKISPVGPTIAAASITTDDREVVRFAIMAFEYWDNPIALKYFESIKIQSKWIDKYKNKVISKLREVV